MQPGDDLDGLLRAFFRSQLPQPWPTPRVLSDVTSCQRRPANGRSLIRSRWSLAASVAILLSGSLLLPSRFASDDRTEHGTSGPFISSGDILPKPHKDHKQKGVENKNKPGLAADDDDQPRGFDDLR